MKDVVAANVYLGTQPDYNGAYNVAYGRGMSINELAKRIVKLTGSKSEIQYGSVRAGDVRHSRANINNLLNVGFEPNEDFDSGLQRTIEFFKERPGR